MSRSFTGFHPDGAKFFAQLKRKQDREWFKAHKAEYEALWVEPMQALMEDLNPALSRAYRGFTLSPPKIFRIYRDVRFSNDKTPFKTNISAGVSIEVPRESQIEPPPLALYLDLGDPEEIAAAGHWMLGPESLATWRRQLLDDDTGQTWARKASALTKKGFEIASPEKLKRAPKGVDPTHPRAELLKFKGFGFKFPAIPASARHSPSLVTWLAAQVKQTAPFVIALERALADSTP